MPAAAPVSYRRAVRVVLDFSAAERWHGTLRCDADPQAVTSFEGRLDLLRILEAIVDVRTGTTTPSERGGQKENT